MPPMHVQHQLLCIDASPVAIDSRCLPQLLSEVAACYQAAAEGRQAALEAPAFQYIDVAFARDAALSATDIVREQQYWLQQLAACAGSLHPLAPALGDLPAVDGAAGTANALPLPLDLALCRHLRGLAEELGLGLEALLLAALQALVFLETAQVRGGACSYREGGHWWLKQGGAQLAALRSYSIAIDQSLTLMHFPLPST